MNGTEEECAIHPAEMWYSVTCHLFASVKLTQSEGEIHHITLSNRPLFYILYLGFEIPLKEQKQMKACM